MTNPPAEAQEQSLSNDTMAARGSTLLKESILVAIVPVLGWGTAYAYNFGRATYLGIPAGLIEVSIPDILHSIGAIIAPIGVLLIIANSILQFVKSDFVIGKIARFDVILGILIVVALKVSQAGAIWWIYSLGGLFLLVAISIGLSMLFAKDVAGVANKFKHIMLHDGSNSPTNASHLIIQSVGLGNYGFIFASYLIVFLSFLAGMGSAANERVYFQLEKTNRVLVATDNGAMLFESFSAHLLTGNILVIPSANVKPTVLIAKDVGPLRTPSICNRDSC